ncbi:hypothetical protein ncot_17065 [Nocardioides sp. JQ2195]|uniref:hypothetical protein n=1 Tax=Nocardioides sp. JQ2195 TaxID=2592334 RepID=UPI00143EEE63|nr:hypothetical protein [Nocardioides sp. JQ2195]QIX28111.1 hypothetical protein ncot_17065 [Nocardioides sp. JQ2195]
MHLKRLLSAALGAALVATAPLMATTVVPASATDGSDRGDDVTAQAPAMPEDGQFTRADLDVDLGHDRAQRAAAPTIPSRVRASSKSQYKYNEPIKIKGSVQAYPSTTTGGCAANTWCNINADGDKVLLLKKKAGASEFKVVDTKGPNSYGRFTFRTKSKGNAVYALYYAGTTTVKPSSASKKVKGTRHPHLKVRARDGRVHMSGDIAPGWERKRVLVQRSHREHGTYRTWAKPRTNRRGEFRIRLVAPATGKWHYRLVIPKNNITFATFKSGSWGVYRRYS